MFRLTREVRFAIGPQAAAPPAAHNGHAGDPPLTGLGYYFIVQLTLAGQPDPRSNYLLNIREVDERVRKEGVPLVRAAVDNGRFGAGGIVARDLFDALRRGWSNGELERLRLLLSPFLSVEVNAKEHPMVRLSQRFEFSAAHRLHNPDLNGGENRKLFGKCSNPHYHGHNYELAVTVVGEPDAMGGVIEVPTLEQIVIETVVEKFDHKNLNLELEEFSEMIPTVENIAAVIYRLLRPRFEGKRGRLASVTVWETPKTWCEYSEQ